MRRCARRQCGCGAPAPTPRWWTSRRRRRRRRCVLHGTPPARTWQLVRCLPSPLLSPPTEAFRPDSSAAQLCNCVEPAMSRTCGYGMKLPDVERRVALWGKMTESELSVPGFKNCFAYDADCAPATRQIHTANNANTVFGFPRAQVRIASWQQLADVLVTVNNCRWLQASMTDGCESLTQRRRR